MGVHNCTCVWMHVCMCEHTHVHIPTLTHMSLSWPRFSTAPIISPDVSIITPESKNSLWPWPGGSAGWSPAWCGFDPQSGHVQEATEGTSLCLLLFTTTLGEGRGGMQTTVIEQQQNKGEKMQSVKTILIKKYSELIQRKTPTLSH